jgi:hypothetical protein
VGDDWEVSWDGSPLAVPAGADDGRGGRLVAQYKKVKNVTPQDWMGRDGDGGIISRSAAALQHVT